MEHASTLHSILHARDGQLPPRALYEFGQPLLEQLMTLTAERDDGLAPLLTTADILVEPAGNTWRLTPRPAHWGTEPDAVVAYGRLLIDLEETKMAPSGGRLAAVARRCLDHEAVTFAQAHTLFERSINRRLFTVLLLVLAGALVVLYLHAH